jgi:hypothetical protein
MLPVSSSASSKMTCEYFQNAKVSLENCRYLQHIRKNS